MKPRKRYREQIKAYKSQQEARAIMQEAELRTSDKARRRCRKAFEALPKGANS